MNTLWLQNPPVQHFAILLGAGIYAAGLNLFVLPLHLYSGGAVGLAQLMELAVRTLLPLSSGQINLYGILYFLINLPPLILAWQHLGRMFLLKTIEGIAAISFFMAVIPVSSTPVLGETIACVLIGGCIAGCGIGILLTAGGSGGGLDIIGVLAARTFPQFSVGKLTICFNAILFVVYLLLFDPATALYSLLFMIFYSMLLDRTHYQNINVRLMIFTKKDGLDWNIMKKTARGVTEWTGLGAYTGESTHILITIISKYEINAFLEIIHSIDPSAFVIQDDGVTVFGNFEKRL